MNGAETFTSCLQQAEAAMHRRQWDAAERLLMRAHGMGHGVKAEHLRAHRALIRLGEVRRAPMQMVMQSALLVLAWMFDRETRTPEPMAARR